MASYRTIRDFDWTLLLIALSVSILGILQIYSATHETKWANVWWKQLIYLVVGLALMWSISKIDYHTLLGQVPLFYVVSVVLLGAVLMFGTSEFGSRRWIHIGPVHFQVSEFAKVVIILLVARYLTNLRRDHVGARELLKLGMLVAVPMALIIRQPDMSTALSLVPVFAVGIFLAGLRLRQMLILGALAVAVPLFAYHFILQDYQKGRLMSFRDPEADPKGSGYQVIQSQIAIGSGQTWGRGAGQGTQTQLRFLPVPHTDFIFATFGEEHGFVGVVAILGLYLLLVLQIVQNARTAPDRAGMYVCMGVASVLLFHLLVNVGMVSGRMPVAGIPLPLMSAGGSSLVCTFLMLGLVNNVRLRRFVN